MKLTEEFAAEVGMTPKEFRELVATVTADRAHRRNETLEEAAAALEKHAHDIVKAADQFDKGGDIYFFYKPTMQAAAIVRALKL